MPVFHRKGNGNPHASSSESSEGSSHPSYPIHVHLRAERAATAGGQAASGQLSLHPQRSKTQTALWRGNL